MVVLTHHGRGLLSHICISGFLRPSNCGVSVQFHASLYIKPSYGDGKKNLFAMKPIGELIKERLKAEERSVAWFARKLSCSRANVYKIFCKEYIDTELLTRISRILNYDFFQYFSEHLKEE